MGLIEFIFGILLHWVWEVFLIGIAKLIMWFGSIIFSVFSLFRVKPKEHYETDSIDKKIGLFWTGLISIIVLIWLIIKTLN